MKDERSAFIQRGWQVVKTHCDFFHPGPSSPLATGLAGLPNLQVFGIMRNDSQTNRLGHRQSEMNVSATPLREKLNV